MTTRTEPTPSETENASLKQIAAEHHALGESLGRLEKTTDPHLLLPRLEKFKSQLEHHFRGEEAGDGIRREVRENAPYLLDSLEKIFEEHRRFVDDIDALHEKVREMVEGPLAEVLYEISRMARRLRDHEVRESELLSDVYYTDYGEGAD